MVAVADVIKKMRAEGMTREQIISSLEELGFPNAEALYERNAGGPPAAPKAPTAPTAQSYASEEKPGALFGGSSGEKEKEREKESEGAGEEKPLFEQQQQQPRKRAEEKDEGGARERETEENAASNEPPELAITQVTDDGLEKTVSIEDMLSKAAAGAGAGGAAQAGAGDAAGGAGFAAAAAGDASLRAKLDETNALLKALADVNKKILETDREVLMRLKARETQAAAQATQSK